MPSWLLQVFGVIGVLAAIATLFQVSVWTWERFAARLIIQCWWELVLDPAKRQRFHTSLSVGIRNPEEAGIRRRRWWDRHMTIVQDLGRWDESEEVWKHLVEPAWPLSVRHVGADGAWALRLLIYNQTPRSLPSAEIEGIDLTIPEPSGIRVLSWQADDGRLVASRTRNVELETVNDSIGMPAALRPEQKVRDDLVVIFNSSKVRIPPAVGVDVRAHINSKVKLYRPSMTKVEAIARLLARWIGGVWTDPRRKPTSP